MNSREATSLGSSLIKKRTVRLGSLEERDQDSKISWS